MLLDIVILIVGLALILYGANFLTDGLRLLPKDSTFQNLTSD